MPYCEAFPCSATDEQLIRQIGQRCQRGERVLGRRERNRTEDESGSQDERMIRLCTELLFSVAQIVWDSGESEAVVFGAQTGVELVRRGG